IEKEKRLFGLEQSLKKKGEDIERKESISTETLRMQMSILEKKEKELAAREADIEKDRIYSEKMLQQEAESLEQREMELIQERKDILKSKIENKETYIQETSKIGINKDEVNLGVNRLKEERAEIESKTLIEPGKPAAETHIFKEDSSPQLPAGLEIKRDRMQYFQHYKYEFISIVIVNLSRCTSDKAVEFKNFLNEIYEENSKKIILDVSFSEFLDSTFLGVMVAFLKQLRRNDREMKVIVELQKMTTTTFILSGLDRVFTLEEDLNAAFYDFYNG
nr:STAS domain-containing protein [Melioribacteraceae bacterium]